MKKIYLLLFSIASALNICLAQMAPNYIIVKDTSQLESETGVKFDLIGSASLAQGGAQAQARGATGVSFYQEGKYQGNLIYSLGNTSTINFNENEKNGGALLVPGNGAQSLQFDLRYFSKTGHFGFNTSLLGALGEWKLNDVTYSVSPVSFKFQGSYLIFKTAPGNKTSILATADLGMTYRGFLGDASTEHDLKKQIFGTTQTGFLGVELSVDLWFNDTHFFFNLPYMFGNKVAGLTNGQVVIGAVVSGKVFKDIGGD